MARRNRHRCRAVDVVDRRGRCVALDLLAWRGKTVPRRPPTWTVNPVPARLLRPAKTGFLPCCSTGLTAVGSETMPWLLPGAKTLSHAVNMAALRHAERHGSGDVVFVSSDGFILEGRGRPW